MHGEQCALVRLAGGRHRDAGHDGDRLGDAVLTELGPDQCGQRVEVGRTAAIQDDERVHGLAAPLVRGTGHVRLGHVGMPHEHLLDRARVDHHRVHHDHVPGPADEVRKPSGSW